MSRHKLSFRGTDYAIPAGYGRCRDCGALVTMEAWLEEACPGVWAPAPTVCECVEHPCEPDARQTERYAVRIGPGAGGIRQICAACFGGGHLGRDELRWAEAHDPLRRRVHEREEVEDMRAEMRATRKPD